MRFAPGVKTVAFLALEEDPIPFTRGSLGRSPESCFPEAVTRNLNERLATSEAGKNLECRVLKLCHTKVHKVY